jgi:hypothetical protein
MQCAAWCRLPAAATWPREQDSEILIPAPLRRHCVRHCLLSHRQSADWNLLKRKGGVRTGWLRKQDSVNNGSLDVVSSASSRSAADREE